MISKSESISIREHKEDKMCSLCSNFTYEKTKKFEIVKEFFEDETYFVVCENCLSGIFRVIIKLLKK